MRDPFWQNLISSPPLNGEQPSLDDDDDERLQKGVIHSINLSTLEILDRQNVIGSCAAQQIRARMVR